MLCFLGHNIAHGNNLRVLSQEPAQETRTPSADTDKTETRFFRNRERHIDHGFAGRWMGYVSSCGMFELESGSGQGAQTQKLAPAWFGYFIVHSPASFICEEKFCGDTSRKGRANRAGGRSRPGATVAALVPG